LGIRTGEMSKPIRDSSEWKSNTLADLCDFSSGLWKGKQPPYRRVAVIRNTNFNADGTLNDSDIAYLDVEVRQFAKRALRFGDTVLEKSGGGPKQPVGRVIQFDKAEGEYSFSNFTACVRSKSPEVLSPDYLHRYLYWLYASGLTERIQSHSTGIRNLNLTAYKALTVSYPPIHEQKRIVSVLDEAFEGITSAEASTQRNLNNSRDLFDSGLESRLAGSSPGWTKRPLSELCEFKHGFAFKSENFLAEGDYVLLTPGNFYEHGGYRERGDKQKYYGGDFPREFLLAPGDLLVAMTEQAAGLLGSPIIVPESGYFLHNQRLGLVKSRPDVPWLNRFFFYAFNTKTFRKAVHDGASGVKVRHTSPTKLGEISVSFPLSLEVQQAVVTEMEEAYSDTLRLEAIYNKKLLALNQLKQSLLYQAFSGNL
jgi:type I restriction enzyme S subunit